MLSSQSTISKHTIRLPDKFDFSYHKTFNSAYEPLLQESFIKEIELDFSQVNYLDSSALGMLVLMAKKFSENKVILTIVGASGTARDIIEMANMSKLYDIK